MKRLFAGLRGRGPAPAYDVVVVGGGVGGLVAAAALGKAGLKVLLVEQHYMIGGYCSTFRRAGFTFDAATHFYPLLGNPTTITGRFLRDLGCRTEWVKMDPVDTFHLPDGSAFVVDADFERYRLALDRRFPAQRAALDTFFDAARQAYADGLLAFFREVDAPRLNRWMSWTLTEALEHFIPDPELRLVLAADCAHWGSPPSRTSFVFDSMLRFSYFLGNYFPVGGSQAFADDLARVVEVQGGDVLMSTACRRVVVHGDTVTGVELETTRGGLAGVHQVACRAVVSNADLIHTLDHLVPPTAASELRRQARELVPTYPCFLTHLGIMGADRDELDRAQGYYWSSWDPDEVGGEGLICKVFVPTLYEPKLAPPGGDIVILQKVLDLERLEGVPWAVSKERIEERLVAHLEKVLPGIGAKVVTRSSASAWTSERFTLNAGGAMLGWEMSPSQLGAARPGRRLPGLRGFHLVGHWTRPGGGITPVIVSAQKVAEEVHAELVGS